MKLLFQIVDYPYEIVIMVTHVLSVDQNANNVDDVTMKIFKSLISEDFSCTILDIFSPNGIIIFVRGAKLHLLRCKCSDIFPRSRVIPRAVAQGQQWRVRQIPRALLYAPKPALLIPAVASTEYFYTSIPLSRRPTRQRYRIPLSLCEGFQ